MRIIISLDIDIEFILNQLTTREKDIIKMYYGIDSKEKDLNEIAIITNLTRERVRQIKEKALRKLRSKAYHSDLLRKYLG